MNKGVELWPDRAGGPFTGVGGQVQGNGRACAGLGDPAVAPGRRVSRAGIGSESCGHGTALGLEIDLHRGEGQRRRHNRRDHRCAAAVVRTACAGSTQAGVAGLTFGKSWTGDPRGAERKSGA